MSIADDISNHLNNKLQQLLKQHASLQKENKELRQQLSVLKEKEINFDKTINEINQKILILKASAGNMEEREQKEFEKRIEQYIKQVDKCISMLSE